MGLYAGAINVAKGIGVVLVAAATAAAAATSAPGEASGRSRGTAVAGRGKHGKLDGGFLTGTLRAGNLLLLVDHNFLKVLFAVVADVFVNGHWDVLIPSLNLTIIAN
jgi:hypothetical protein